MKVFVPSNYLSALESNPTFRNFCDEVESIEEHDKALKQQLLEEVNERLMHYKPQIVDDIGLCVSATILDFFGHIPEELEDKWRTE